VAEERLEVPDLHARAHSTGSWSSIMTFGFGRNATKHSTIPSSIADVFAYSPPPDDHAYIVTPAEWSCLTCSTTGVIGIRFDPNDLLSVSSMST
jgi:hypothetical protein